jgi:CBS domain-containing protein
MGSMERATLTAASVGRGFGYGMIALGFLGAFSGAPGLLWLGLIGLFIIVGGQAEASMVQLQSVFSGLGLRRVMAVPAATLDADQTVEEALRDSFATLAYHAFPVLERGRPVGLLSIDRVASVPSERRATTRIGEVADRDPSVFVDDDVTIEELMTNPGFQRHRRAVVRCHDGAVGIISATAIDRAARARQMLGDHPAAPEAAPAGGERRG